MEIQYSGLNLNNPLKYQNFILYLSDHMIKEYLNYMENDGTIPKREVVTLSDSEDDDVAEVQCSKSIHAVWPELQCGNFSIICRSDFT